MIKTFKKAISLVVLAVFVLSLMPLGVLAEDIIGDGSDTIRFTNWVATRDNGSKASPVVYGDTSHYGYPIRYDSGSNDRRAYMQLDFSGYEEILDNESTTVSVTFDSYSSSTSYSLKNFDVYAMDDSVDFYATEYDSAAEPKYEGDTGIRMLFDEAAAAGLHDYEEKGVLLASRSDAAAKTYTFDASAKSLSSMLKTGVENSVVTFSVRPTSGSGYIFATATAVGATINYDVSEIDNADYVNTIAEEMPWDAISDQDISAVTADLTLPARYLGADVSWSSSNTDVISDDGVVTLGTTAGEAVLTATLSYSGLDEAEYASVATKEFTVKTGTEAPDSLIIPFTNYGNARSDKTNAQKYSVNTSYTSVHYLTSGGIWRAYAQLDLTGYEEIIKNPGTSFKLQVMAGNGFGSSAAYDYKVYLAADSADGYDNELVTFNEASELGIFDTTRPVLAERTDSTKAANGTLFENEVSKENLIDVLDESAANSIVTLYFAPGESGQQSSYRINDAEAGLVINYYESEADNQAYMAELAQNLTWEDVSSDSAGAVVNNLSNKIGGATAVWSADVAGVITEDGVIKASMNAQDVTLTADLSYVGINGEEATAAVSFDVTIAPEVPKTVRIPFTNYAYSRSSASDNADAKNYAYKHYTYGSYDCIIVGGSFDGYVQLDLTGYEEILRNPSTTATVGFECGLRYTTARLNPLAGYIAPASTDTYDGETITHNIATEYGLIDRTNPQLFATSDAGLTPGQCTSADVDLSKLIAAMDDDKLNGIVSLYLGNISGESNIRINSQNSGVFVTYYESEIDEDAYYADIENSFIWENISADSMDAVENDLSTYFNGANVVWEASEDVINSDGTIKAFRGDNIDATLTANVEYNGQTFTKAFDVTVLSELLKELVIPLKYGTYISRDANTTACGVYDSSFYSRYIYPAGLYGNGNDRQVYLQWDFTDNLDKLAAAQGISINLKSVEAQTSTGKITRFSVLPDGYESWTEADLTYDIAVEKGLYTAPAVATTECQPISSSCEITSSAEILEGIKKSVSDNPSNGTVNFRWEATTHSPTIYRLSNNNKDHFTLTLYYYESDVVSGDEFINNQFESVSWAFVSDQDQNSVVADLTLPDNYYGAPVTWTSSNEDVISSSGEVVAGSADTSVQLTATVNGVSKVFDVTVPTKNFVVRNTTSYQNDDVASNTNTTTHIYSNTDYGTIPTMIVATYNDGVLRCVNVYEDYEIKKGENTVYSDTYYGDPKALEVKVFFMGELSALAPMYDVNNK